MSVVGYARGSSVGQSLDVQLDKLKDCLELDDTGFDHSVLSEFRRRLVSSSGEERVLEVLLDQLKAKGWLRAGGKQRTDSTHVLAAIRNLSRLESVGETLRATLNDLATVTPNWLRDWMPDE